MRAKLGFIFCAIIALTSCKDNGYFNGELKKIDCNKIEKLTIAPKGESIESLSPFFAVHDTLLFFSSPNIGEEIYKIYHVENMKYIGGFYKRGHGNGEYIAMSIANFFYTEDNELKTLLYAPNEEKMIVWNITKSILSGKTISESVADYGIKDKIASYSKYVPLAKDTILTYTSGRYLSSSDEITLPTYHVRTLSTNKGVYELNVFKNAINNKSSTVMPERFFSTSFCIKPDRTKFAEAMFRLPQINIVDIKKKEIKGFIMENGEDFSIFKTDMTDARYYYHRIQSNDNYIFALWCGKTSEENKKYVECKELHVFDWEGNLLKKVVLTVPVGNIHLDLANNIIYSLNPANDRIYLYHISDMNLP